MPLRADMRPAAEARIDHHREEHVVTLERNAAWGWMLLYSSGVQIWSKDTALPIWEQPQNAKALFAVDPSGTPRAPGIDLQKYGVQYLPIFYRKVEAGVSLRADDVDWENRSKTFNAFRSLSGIVYGRAKLPEEGYEAALGALFAVVGGVFGACPPEYLDEAAVKRCLGMA